MKEIVPFNEETRLRVLKKYEILDTADESVYDNLVALAAKVCNAPMAAICLIDEYRQWFKARVGFDVRQTDRCLSFCAHTILKSEQIMVVPDASVDFRFCDSDLVVGEPFIRFYTGVALLTPEGLPLGAISVMDREVREISDSEIEMLCGLARQVEALLENRRNRIVIQDQNEALERAREDALSAAKAKSVFLSNISHEFRTPINGIMGISSLLTESSLQEQQRHYVDLIESSAAGLLGVLSDILEVSKNDVGDSGIAMAKFSTLDMVGNLATIMRPVSIAKGIRLEVRFDEKLRQGLVGDRLRIQQILTNLLGNALKFTNVGMVELIVKQVGEKHGAAVVRYEIRDSGIGIPFDMRPKIFDEFVQVEQGVERNFGGAGVGLTIARQLARLMGTQINVNSELGVGSTFWFDLVMPYADAWMNRKVSEQPSQSTSSSSLGKILVVEDNEVNAMVLTSLLESKGFDVTRVLHSEEAVRLVRQGRYDLVFMDVKMPDMDGLQSARAIRHLAFPASMTPIVGMAATIRKEIETLCKSIGMNDFITMPLSDQKVSRTIDKWLAKTAEVSEAGSNAREVMRLETVAIRSDNAIPSSSFAPRETVAVI